MLDTTLSDPRGVDLGKILVKITYLGLFLCVFSPGAYIVIAYILDTPDRIQPDLFDERDLFFWGILALSIILAGTGLFLKSYLFKKPMIVSEMTFAKDLEDKIILNSIILFGLCDVIAILGISFFFLGGGVRDVMLFSVISVIVFQLIRPRMEFLDRCNDEQDRLVSQGAFAPKPTHN